MDNYFTETVKDESEDMMSMNIEPDDDLTNEIEDMTVSVEKQVSLRLEGKDLSKFIR